MSSDNMLDSGMMGELRFTVIDKDGTRIEFPCKWVPDIDNEENPTKVYRGNMDYSVDGIDALTLYRSASRGMTFLYVFRGSVFKAFKWTSHEHVEDCLYHATQMVITELPDSDSVVSQSPLF